MSTPSRRRYGAFIWGALAYTVGVILFGAFVRITGSGAGCGQHWPTCHGEIVHLPERLETLIELTHRTTSGLALLFAFVIGGWALVAFPTRHPARRAGLLTVLFMITEALIGAALVLLQLVGLNDSVPRAVVMALHLSNTCLLTAAMVVAASCAKWEVDRLRFETHRSLALVVLASLVALVVVSMSGAVTALGDTLYPVTQGADLPQRIAEDHGIGSHFLQRMRIIHPILAVLSALLISWAGIAAGRAGAEARRIGNLVTGLAVAQVSAGVINIVLNAPATMQLVHLGLATVLWIALVRLGCSLAGSKSRLTGSRQRRS